MKDTETQSYGDEVVKPDIQIIVHFILSGKVNHIIELEILGTIVDAVIGVDVSERQERSQLKTLRQLIHFE